MNNNVEVKEFERQIRVAYSAIAKEREESKKIADLLNKEWNNQQIAYYQSQVASSQRLKCD